MIWLFTRGSAQVDIEVRRVGEPPIFELVVDYPDGSEEVRRFTEGRKLVRRTLRLQRQLIRDGWAPSNPDLPRMAAPRPTRSITRVRRARRFWSRLHRHVADRFAATFGL